jgi:hypothetical protein
MSDDRPFDQRPAARPAPPSQPLPGQFGPPDQAVPKPGGMGCFGVGCIGVVVVVAVIAVIALGIIVVGAVTSGVNTASTGSSTGQGPAEQEDSGVSGEGTSADPIEQARVVLGGAYAYDTVKSVTDAALSATGTPATSENYSRAWSAVLTVSDNLEGVDPMAVMECVGEIGAASGFDFPEAAALCATEIQLGG